jgi:hypothetical protein
METADDAVILPETTSAYVSSSVVTTTAGDGRSRHEARPRRRRPCSETHVADEVLVGLADSLGVGVVPRPGREGPGRPLSASPTGAVPRNSRSSPPAGPAGATWHGGPAACGRGQGASRCCCDTPLKSVRDEHDYDRLTFGSNCPIGSDGLRRALFGPIPVPREPGIASVECLHRHAHGLHVLLRHRAPVIP